VGGTGKTIKRVGRHYGFHEWVEKEKQ
jgi:hypothetical protein